MCPFQAIFLGIDHSITNVWVDDLGNWFNFRSRSYRKDRKAVKQLIRKGGQIKGIVEAIYIEGNPIPLGSNLKRAIFSDFADEPTKDTLGVAFFGWFDEA